MRQNTNHETPKEIPYWEDNLCSINQKITIFRKFEGSQPCSHELATVPYPEQDNPHRPTLLL